MANWFVDTILGSVANDGSSTDDAWDSIETAMEYGGFAAGDKVWIKRDSLYTCAGGSLDIIPTETIQTAKLPLYFIGWPRAVILNTTITQAGFTNGSNIIDNVVGITPDREKHVGRYITAPDGFQYMITAVLWEADIDGMAGGAEFTLGSKLTNTTQTKYGKIWGFTDDLDNTGTIQYVRDPVSVFVENDNITDADGGNAEIEVGGETAVGFLIDREYAGSTVTTTNGKFQIEADEDYTEAQAIDDSGFTIKLSTWDDDADDLPLVDFAGFSSDLQISSKDYLEFRNIDFQSSSDGSGILRIVGSIVTFLGCLIYQDQNTEASNIGSGPEVFFERCIIEGIGSGASNGLQIAGRVTVKDAAIYNFGSHSIYTSADGVLFLQNVNLGIECDEGSYNLRIAENIKLIGKGVALGGGGSGEVNCIGHSSCRASIEDYNKNLGVHREFTSQGNITKLAVVPGSGDPYKRSGGADNVISIEFDKNTNRQQPVPNITEPIFTHEFEATTDSKSYRYYVQCEGIVTAAQLYIIAEYVESYDDTSEYTMTIQQSDEAFTARADAEDWAEYMEVTGIQPAIGSKVRIKCYCSFYHATENIYIDPMVVIS